MCICYVNTYNSVPIHYFLRILKVFKKNWNGVAWWWGCWFLALSLSVYCQEILTNLDCQGLRVTLLLNWERKLAGFCALCSTVTEFHKQEPGALHEGTGEVKGKSHRVIYRGKVPDKLLTWRRRNFMCTFCARKPSGGAEADRNVDVGSSEYRLSRHEEAMILCSYYLHLDLCSWTFQVSIPWYLHSSAESPYFIIFSRFM